MRDVSASARRWAFDSSPAAPSSSPPGWLSALLNAVYARSESSLRAAPPRPANTSGAATTRRAADADAPAARGSWSAATRTWRTVVREVEEESSMGAESSVIAWSCVRSLRVVGEKSVGWRVVRPAVLAAALAHTRAPSFGDDAS